MIGLDTSAIIDIFKGDNNIKQFLKKNKEPLAATLISYLDEFESFCCLLNLTHSNHFLSFF